MTVLRRLAGIRGRLVLWYLGILAILLLGVGTSLSLSMASYLHTTTIDSLQDTARSEMALLGPCYIRSTADLRQNAQKLADLLGSREVAVKVVMPSGVSLADHVAGAPGAGQPLRLSASTIRTLIQSAQSGLQVQALRVTPPKCLQPPLRSVPPRIYHHRTGARRTALQSGDLALVAVPLGPPGDALGYAILGRSMAAADDTVRQARVVFGLGAIVALLVALLVALPIINRALRPLNRVARTAEAIAAGDLEKRANLAQSPDEIGRLGSAFDRMVDRLQWALSAATESEERMRRFLADASHELRTPLTALRGTSEVLLRRGTTGNPEADRALRAMHEETVRLSRLVDDLLTLSRLDAGQPLDPQPVVVGDFLQRFVDRYASVWPSRTIRVDTVQVNGARAFVDPDALTRALTNLVDNAARYSAPPGSITLSGDADGRTVVVRVEDEGPGLDPEDADRIFERFYRGAKSRSRRSGGTGLGLAIVDALVRQSGGDIHVETGPDRGTSITMTFPRPTS